MRAHAAFASTLLLCLLPGCAQFILYDKSKNELKGFKYYTAKPYVLVGRTGSTEEPFSITPLYLPDLDNPVYAKAKPGWLGNSNLKMDFNDNGTLKSFGQEGNNGAADLLTSLGGLAKSLAEAQVARASIPAPDEPITSPEGKSIALMLERAHTSADRSLDSVLKGQQLERDAFNAPNEMLARTAKELATPATTPGRRALEKRLRDVLVGWNAQVQTLKDGRDNEVNARLAEARAIVIAAIRRIRSKMDAHFTLYEVMEGATPWLREVDFFPSPPPPPKN